MKQRVILVIVAVSVVATAAAYYWAGQAQEPPAFVTARVTRGDVVETVDATGTLAAVTTVHVGTQVSGTIKALHADFNSPVRRGAVIAELEPSLFESQVQQAEATVARLIAERQRAVVQGEDAEAKLRRARELAARQLLPAVDLETAEVTTRQAATAIASADAQIVQARAALNHAQVNLAHTIIRSPIDGIVISRHVDAGQTVAASMQAPTLFVIAQNLARMQVNARISEADISRITPDQPVTFRVDAYPNEVFTGKVSQVRLEPVVEQTVVSYVTVIDVRNPHEKLKPGMTATVTVETARAPNALRIPNTAIRFKPPAEVLAAYGLPTSVGASHDRGAEVWLVEHGQLRLVRIAPGISDGTMTAVATSEISEGTEVVTAVRLQPSARQGSSPLLPFGSRRGGAGGTRPSTGERR